MRKPFDLLVEFGKFGLEREISLREPATLSAFNRHIDEEVKRALNDPLLLHGQRTEAMFEALLVCLGGFELLKAEDNSRVFPNDRYRVPDFRIVLNDGAHWLIEVKNVYEHDPFRQRRRLFRESDITRLTAYAQATGAELKIAVFWARWSIWTLVSPDRLIRTDGGLDLDMQTAIRANELSRLGDRTIGSRPPFRLRLAMDPKRTNPIGADGEVLATIGGVQVFCGDDEVTEPVEKEIVWTLMQYGEWQEKDPESILDGDRLLALEYRWKPEELTEHGFEIVGTLSRMFARYYAQHTVDGGAVVQLRAPLQPNWFAPLVDIESSRALPLWRFAQKPSFDAPEGKAFNDNISC